ncbi:hypothetical protein CHUAL_004942 [Chamberlinius hualienensis]
MSLQWTLIATFLYAEIAFVIILLLPFISAQRWQRFFKSKFLQTLEKQANIYFTVFILILVLFFLDAIREMKKYTGELDENKGDSHSHLSAELQVHMKLFRAQRNFYIAGFSLFLWLVLRRLVTLISAQATLLASNEASLKQARNAAETASKLLEEATKKKSESADNSGNEAREVRDKEIEILKRDLTASKEELRKAKIDLEAMEKQSLSVKNEYDRLLAEHGKLQEKLDRADGVQHSKKDE